MFAVLPTGYGKSLAFACVSVLCLTNCLSTGGEYCSIAVVATPLTAIMNIHKFNVIIFIVGYVTALCVGVCVKGSKMKIATDTHHGM